MKRNSWRVFIVGFAMVVFWPVYRAYAEPVPLILDLREDLRLTDKQQSEIKAVYLHQYRNRRLFSAKITIADLELEELIEQEGDLEQIRKKLREKADLQTSLRFSEIEMERRVNSLLSPEQLKRWRAFQNPSMR